MQAVLLTEPRSHGGEGTHCERVSGSSLRPPCLRETKTKGTESKGAMESGGEQQWVDCWIAPRIKTVLWRVIQICERPFLQSGREARGRSAHAFGDQDASDRRAEPIRFDAWDHVNHAPRRGGSGQGRGRTADTRIFSPLLYQLSYLTRCGWLFSWSCSEVPATAPAVSILTRFPIPRNGVRYRPPAECP